MLQSFPSVRLVALDLDGTLLSRNNEVTPATREAIARAVAHGVAVVPATGRPASGMPSPPTVRPCGIWVTTPWVLYTAATPMPPSAIPVSPPACCTV